MSYQYRKNPEKESRRRDEAGWLIAERKKGRKNDREPVFIYTGRRDWLERGQFNQKR